MRPGDLGAPGNTVHRVDVGFAVVIEFFAFNLEQRECAPECGDNFKWFPPRPFPSISFNLLVWSTGVCID